ncbi:hypothetical protein [Pelagicoccus mobilis]|uniref:Uncharacterized protein n=1 Tax=Pelagicoccus mobilis TaxID=415221 RepID=A0A934RXE1_9BACT|nr:hypothetical protein [Pelagicoccus mobilis]MBK1875328.1 hypothetical protein [Pelagicoccus mobilis]
MLPLATVNSPTRLRKILAGALIQYLALTTAVSAKPAKKDHIIHVRHPGDDGSGPETQTLVQRFTKNKKAKDYYLDAESVFCADGECSIVNVRIFWDSLGYYDRFELEPGVELEKAEGAPFTAEDYQRLHEILGERDSVLKDVKREDIKNHEAELIEDPHATSGATPEMFEGAAVEGAAWTSYTLWHWANGELSKRARALTTSLSDRDDLHAYLKSGDVRAKSFALEEMRTRNINDTHSMEIAVTALLHTPRETSKLALRYFDSAPSSDRNKAYASLFESGSTEQRVLILNSLLDSESLPSPSLLKSFTRHLLDLKNYQEVDLLLRLLQREEPPSTQAIDKVAQLLNTDNFIFARRAFWFLSDVKIPSEYLPRVDAFAQRHQSRL